MIEAILLDHGNVLSKNSGPDISQICDFFKSEYGESLTTTSVEKALKETLTPFQEGAIEERYFWQNFLREVKIVQPINLEESIWKRLGIMHDHLSKYKQGAIDIILKLKSRFPKLGLLSNSVKPLGEINRERGRYNYFGEYVFLSYELGFEKPKKEAYQISCKRMGVYPESTLFVDDSKKNVDGARENGLIAVPFDAGKQPYDDLYRNLVDLGVL